MRIRKIAPGVGFLDNRYVLDNIFTTKGDIFVATGSATPVRLGVGANDEILTADSAQAGGVKWAAAAAGGATTALDNLASVAINISLISDTDSTDDLGSSTIAWANLYVDKILAGNGTRSAPSYSFLSDTDTGMYRVTTNNLAFTAGGVIGLEMTSTRTIIQRSGSSPGTPLLALGDFNTGLFSPGNDILAFAAGGFEFLRLKESTSGNTLIVNEGGHDINSRIEGDTDTNLFTVDAGLDRVGIGIGLTGHLGKFHVDQFSTTGAIPVLYLDQADVSEEMIEFNTTIGTGNAIEAIGAKTLTTTHFIKVTLPGGLIRYIPAGTIA